MFCNFIFNAVGAADSFVLFKVRPTYFNYENLGEINFAEQNKVLKKVIKSSFHIIILSSKNKIH